jgi:hypothetical protein
MINLKAEFVGRIDEYEIIYGEENLRIIKEKKVFLL